MSLAASHKSLQLLGGVVAIDRRSGPMAAILSVGQARPMVAYLAELAACAAVEAPPDTYRYAIVGGNHCLANVVELVGVGHVALVDHLLPEVGERVELARQLMGVAPCGIGFHGIVPLGGIVVVERVARRDGNILETWIILLELARYLLEVGLRSLVPRRVVGLVERRNSHDLMARVILLHPCHRGIDEPCPMVGVGHIVLGVIGNDKFGGAVSLVGVEHHVDIGAHEVDGVGAAA